MIEKAWASTEKAKVNKIEDKEQLSLKEKEGLIKDLIDASQKNLERCNTAYASFRDTDLGSVITRLEQNITQLKKIKNALNEE